MLLLHFKITSWQSRLLKGVGLHVLWPEYVALAVLGIVVFAGAVGRFRKRLD